MRNEHIQKNITVVILNGEDPFSSRASGIKSYVWNLTLNLAKQGINTTLIGITKQKHIKNYPFNFISTLSRSKTSSIIFLSALFIRCFSFKISKSAIIHAQRPDDLLPFVLFFRKNSKVCTLHGMTQKKILLKKGRVIARIYEIIENFTLRRIDSVISVDESTSQFYINKYPWIKEKLTVIPVGIDLTRFMPMNKLEMRRKYGFSNDDKIIMYIGRLEAEKNLEFLIDVFCELRSKSRKLVFVGGGKDRNRLQQKCISRGLKSVIFLGEFDQDRVPEILNCADLFVLTSLFESGPLVVIEAIACNIPVISTDVGRVKEYINSSGMGLICKMDKLEFANEIDKFLSNQGNFKYSNSNFLYNFSFAETLLKTKEIYYGLKNLN